jgi:hypothetical protein
MDERLKNWHPTKAEVEEIVRELRPIIRDLARQEAASMVAGLRRPRHLATVA